MGREVKCLSAQSVPEECRNLWQIREHCGQVLAGISQPVGLGRESNCALADRYFAFIRVDGD